MTRRGTDNITVRMSHELWERFGEATDNRSTVVRDFVRWFVREPGAKMPQRPGVSRTAEGDQGGDQSPSAA